MNTKCTPCPLPLNKKCRKCSINLTTVNAVKRSDRKTPFVNMCMGCKADAAKSWAKNHREHRNKTVNKWSREIGRVKQYPCLTCLIPCYKKYAQAFCSTKCRLLSKIQKKENGCWIWQHAKNKNGYGKTNYNSQKAVPAHRAFYLEFKGQIDDNLLVCHHCDVPSCVNPDHLFLGSHAENMLDMIAKDRQQKKLEAYDVFEIRKLWDKGISNKKLSEMFKITSGHVSNIVNRRIWKHI